MKKKLVLLTASLASVSLAITAIIFARNNFSFDQVNASEFTLAPNGIDVKKEVIVNNKSGAKVNTTFFDASLDEGGIYLEANKYVTWSNDIDSPIRGIDYVSIFTDLASSYIVNSNIDIVIYTSYNHLNFEDIQFGKYSDLSTQGMYLYSYISLGDGNFKCNIDNDNARYFLIVICSKMDVHITDVTINSICNEEPSGSEDIGVFDHYLEDEASALPNDFPFIGNGAYQCNPYLYGEVEFFISGYKGNTNLFRYSLVEYGYSLVDTAIDIHNTYTYQKYNPDYTSEDDKYFTLTITEGDEYDDFVFNENIKYYSNAGVEITPDHKSNSWPSNKIGQYVENIGYQSIASDPYIAFEGINYYFDEYSGIAYATFTNEEEETLQTILDGFKEYKTRFEDIGFILTYETDYDHSKEPYISAINYKLLSPKLDYRALFIYQVSKTAGGDIKCSINFEFEKNNLMGIDDFNIVLEDHELPGITVGSMKFVNRESLYGSPIKASDLYTYAEVLGDSGVTVTRVNKNELISDKISFTRYKNSLTYKITF